MSIPPAGTTSARIALLLINGMAGDPSQYARPKREQRETSPVLIIDPRTSELAASLQKVDGRAAERTSIEALGGVTASAAQDAGMAARRDMLASAEASVAQTQSSIDRGTKVLELFEKTGELHQFDQSGNLAPYRPSGGWRSGELEDIIKATRVTLEGAISSLPSQMEDVQRMRSNLEPT